MALDVDQLLQRYAEVVVKVGLNLQSGQRLLIGNYWGLGAPLEAAPLLRRIAAVAYQAGAQLVDVIWSDDQLQVIRCQHAARDSFEEYPAWQANLALEYFQRGDAMLVIYAGTPDLLKEQDPAVVATLQQTAHQYRQPLLDHLVRNTSNRSIIAAAVPGWAAKVFPALSPEEQVARLWAAIFAACRLHEADPIAAWQAHAHQLTARAHYLNRKRYAALHYTAPGTDLTIGLPAAHLWRGSARFISATGIPFIPNLPTEEVFTLPHRDRTEGVVSASMPLSYGGSLIEKFILTFAAGQVVKVSAEQGETVLRQLVETDEGAGRLGEVALVPQSSPIAQSGLLYYNTLLDENAANHLALGRALRFSLCGGEGMADEEFTAAGGNHSLIHVDFMIGSGEMDVDGITAVGAVEPIMRAGEWAFEV